MLNKILFIDLTSKTYSSSDIEVKILFEYLGGLGLGIYHLYQDVSAQINPFNPLATVGVFCGPVSGTKILGGNRFGLFFKSPLTGIFGETYSTGKISNNLTGLGYIGLIIRGYSEKPTWILVNENGVEFKDATGLWGSKVPETEQAVKKEVKSKNLGVISIGPAGENLVRYASVVNDTFFMAPRCGGGAVLGSKNLKSIVIDSPDLNSTRQGELKAIEEEFIGNCKEKQKLNDPYILAGELSIIDQANKLGVFPTRYWSFGSSENYMEFSSEKISSSILEDRYGCGDCPLKCKFICRYPDGKSGAKYHLSYEAVNAFGGICELADVTSIAKMNGLCFELGVDPASLGNAIGFAIEMIGRGKLRLADIPEYGELKNIMSLAEQICYRDQMGFYFSDGIKIAAKKINYNNDLIEIKGLEPIGLDPRGLQIYPLFIGVSESGGSHGSSTLYAEELFQGYKLSGPDIKISKLVELTDKISLVNSLMICDILAPLIDWKMMERIASSTFKVQYGERVLKMISEKIINLLRHFLFREGLKSSDDILPTVFYEHPILTGASKGKVLDNAVYKRDLERYYLLRSFSKDGFPLKKTMLDRDPVSYYF